jgi:hypothetical protein
MSNLRKHAISEFHAAGWTDENGVFEDDMQEAICKHVLKLLDVFTEEGHSGTSAPYTINLFKTLAMFDPIVPLSGDDSEWLEVGPGVFQNKRCGYVFKDVTKFNGQAYNFQGKIFREPNGCCYTSSDSRVLITFPYTPKSEYIDVPFDNTETNQDDANANPESSIGLGNKGASTSGPVSVQSDQERVQPFWDETSGI